MSERASYGWSEEGKRGEGELCNLGKEREDNDGVVVEERMDVLIIGILMVACLGLILIVVAVYFFRKMVAIENSKFSSNSQISFHFCRQVICCLQKEREGTDVGKMFKEKINRAAVVERV